MLRRHDYLSSLSVCASFWRSICIRAQCAIGGQTVPINKSLIKRRREKQPSSSRASGVRWAQVSQGLDRSCRGAFLLLFFFLLLLLWSTLAAGAKSEERLNKRKRRKGSRGNGQDEVMERWRCSVNDWGWERVKFNPVVPAPGLRAKQVSCLSLLVNRRSYK